MTSRNQPGPIRSLLNWSTMTIVTSALVFMFGGGWTCVSDTDQDGEVDPPPTGADVPTPVLGTSGTEVMGGAIAESATLFGLEGDANWVGLDGLSAEGGEAAFYAQYPNLYSLMYHYQANKGSFPKLQRLESLLADYSLDDVYWYGGSRDDMHIAAITALEIFDPSIQPYLMHGENVVADESFLETRDPLSIGLGMLGGNDELEALVCFANEFNLLPGIVDPFVDAFDALGGLDCSGLEDTKALIEEIGTLAVMATSAPPVPRLASSENEGGESIFGSSRSALTGGAPGGGGGLDIGPNGIIMAIATILLVLLAIYLWYIAIDLFIYYVTGKTIGQHLSQQMMQAHSQCSTALNFGDGVLDVSDICDCFMYGNNCGAIPWDGITAGAQTLRDAGLVE